MEDGVLKTLTPSDHRNLKKELRGCEGRMVGYRSVEGFGHERF